MQYPLPSGQAWWVMAIGGLAAVLFGLAALLWPGLTLMILITLFGAYALVYGVVALLGMLRAIGAHIPWWPSLLIAVISIGAGIAVFSYPGITTFVLLYVIAVWAIVVGLSEVVAAFVHGQWFLALAGVISIMFGFVLFANPFSGALALVMVIGVFAIVRGLLQLVEAVRAPAVTGTPR